MTAWKRAFHYLSPSVLPWQVRGFTETSSGGHGTRGNALLLCPAIIGVNESMASAHVLIAVAVGVTFCHAGEVVHFKNGTRMEVTRHEQDGDSLWLYNASGFIHVSRSEVERIEDPNAVKPETTNPELARPVMAEPPVSDRTGRLIYQTAMRHGLPPELVHALVQEESMGQQRVRSKSGAIGIMQLMPSTAEYFGANPYNARQNVEAGVRLLRDLLIRYQDDPDQVALALAAYNAGPGAVERWRGVPPYPETQRYVRKILERYMTLTGQ